MRLVSDRSSVSAHARLDTSSRKADREAHDRRRELGAFYTPDRLALLLTRWALAEGPGPVLDPSFGGCSFLRSAIRVLDEIGESNPGALVFGVDIDQGADRFAKELHRLGVPQRNLRRADFFSIRPDTFPAAGGFQAVVGNPPYVRHQRFGMDRRDLARAAVESHWTTLDGRSDAWVYFLLHSIRFVRPGGRLAMLLPRALLEADYSQSVRAALRRSFAVTRVIDLEQRQFEETKERPLLVLCKGRGQGAGTLSVEVMRTLSGCRASLSKEGDPRGDSQDIRSAEWKWALLPSGARDAWSAAIDDARVVPLGDLATIRIGVVTGANRFFLRSRDEARHLVSPGVYFRTAVARNQWLGGIWWTSRDLQCLDRRGEKTRLIRVGAEWRRAGRLAHLIKEAESEGLDQGHHCFQRQPWYRLRETRTPDAFLRCMGLDAPTISINVARSTCTNAVHRIWWKQRRTPATAIAVAFHTSLAELSAELCGRSYGGGILKLEPSAALKVPVPVVSAGARVGRAVDRMIREGNKEGARQLADEAILGKGIGLDQEVIGALRRAAARLRAWRLGEG